MIVQLIAILRITVMEIHSIFLTYGPLMLFPISV